MTTTHTDPTAAALLRAILLHPECDTARLVYADWLDEHGEHERAEFIRVQAEWERTPSPDRAIELVHRWNAIVNMPRRAEWFGIRCPVCEGAGDFGGVIGSTYCHDCDGTGFAPVEVRRGFVQTVRCRMGDVLREYEHIVDWTLTPWARGVLAAHPVTRWEIADAEPWTNYAGTHWGWWSGNSHTVADASTLPHVVMAALADDSRRRDSNISLRYTAAKAVPNGCVLFASEAEARDALAFAVGRVARRLAGLSEVET